MPAETRCLLSSRLCASTEVKTSEADYNGKGRQLFILTAPEVLPLSPIITAMTFKSNNAIQPPGRTLLVIHTAIYIA